MPQLQATDKNEVTILLAEDDQGHALLIERNLRRANIANRIITVGDGQAALECLFGEGKWAGEEPIGPMLVLLDLNMPVLDGYQVIARMKADARTKRTPIIVLTTTDDHREVDRCYELGCNAYVTKPVDYEQFGKAVHALGLFLSIVAIPDGE